MAANRIFIQVDFQTQSATTAINSLNQNIKSIGTTTEQSTTQATAGVKGFSVSVDQAANSLNQLSAALSGVTVLKATEQLVVMGDQLNRIQRAFAATAGGAQAMQELQRIAEASRFSFADLAASANQLRNFGVAVKDIPSVMRAFSGAVDSAAGNTEDLTHAVQAFGQMTSQQFVTARSVYQNFGAIGLQIMQMLRDQTHKTVQEIRDDTRLLNTDVLAQMIIIQARIKSLEAGPAGESITARFGQLMTSINLLAEELDRALGPSLGKVLGLVDSLVQGLTELTRAFERLPEPVRDVVVGLGSIAALAGVAATAFSAWRAIAPVIATVWGALTGAAAATAAVAEGAGTAATVLTGVISLGTGLGEIAAIVAAIVGGLAWVLSLGEKQKASQPTKDARDQQIADLKTQLANLSKGLYAPDQKKAEEATKRAADALDEANRRNLMIGKESIAALTEAYKAHFRSVAGYAEATALYRKALEVDIATEGKKADEERRKDSLKNIDELLALQRKIEIAQAGVTPDDTFAGRQRMAQLTADAYEEQIRRQTYNQNAEYDRRGQLQIDTLQRMGGHADEIAGWEKRMADNRVEQNAIADAKVQEHRLQTEGETNKLIDEQQKQMAEQSLQDQLSLIDQTKNLRVAALGAVTPDSLPERLKQIRDIQAANIEAIEKTRDTRIAAAKTTYDQFNADNPGATASIAEEYAKFEHTRITESRNAEVEIQLDRFNLWKESNDAIIAEQKKVYEGIKSALDKVWDALLSKSQSVWMALGNALKAAVLNAMKEIITSRLAAGIAGIFGYGTYTFKRGIGGIYEPPSPSGAGEPPAVPGIGSATGGLVPLPPGQGSAQRYVGDAFSALVRGAQAEGSTATDVARVATIGSESRMMETGWETGSPAGMDILPAGVASTLAYSSGGMPPAATRGAGVNAGGLTQMQQTIARLKTSLNIGKPITAQDATYDAQGNPIPAGGTIPWSSATSAQRLGAMIKSPAAAQLGLTLGTTLALAGLQRGGPKGGVETVSGATLAGVSAAFAFPALGLTALGGGLLGAGVGALAYGIQRGGKVGAGFDVGGGALTGAILGTAVFPGLGTAAGAAIGAAVGAVAGGLRILFPGMDQKIRDGVKRIYGIDIPNKQIRDQIAQIITNTYGGNVNVGLYSQEVQNIVRLYSATTGQMAGLPRPEYGVTTAQQGGQLTTQPVYSNGQLVQNPYSGTTTYQYSQRGLYMQLNPNQAMQLFSGQVVSVMQNNPSTVAQSNATALSAGNSRYATQGALLEPNTVMA